MEDTERSRRKDNDIWYFMMNTSLQKSVPAVINILGMSGCYHEKQAGLNTSTGKNKHNKNTYKHPLDSGHHKCSCPS